MPLWAHFRDMRERWCLPGRVTDPGLALVAIWFLTQLDPSLPLMSVRALPDGLPIPNTGFIPPREFATGAAVAVGVSTLAISLFVMALVRRRWHALVAIGSLIATAVLIKLVAGMVMLKAEAAFIWLSAEVVFGIAGGVAVSALVLALPRRLIIGAGVFVLLCSFVSIQLVHLVEDPVRPALALWPFRWNYGQLLNYTGLARTVAQLWPLAGAWYLLRLQRRLRVAAPGGAGQPRPAAGAD
jgi:hypothetical protein